MTIKSSSMQKLVLLAILAAAFWNIIFNISCCPLNQPEGSKMTHNFKDAQLIILVHFSQKLVLFSTLPAAFWNISIYRQPEGSK